MRAELFDDWIQANENWADSTIVINSRKAQIETNRGVYKLMSHDVPQLHIDVGNFADEFNVVQQQMC